MILYVLLGKADESMKRIGILGMLLMSMIFTCCTAWADGGNAYRSYIILTPQIG